ncbi:hypothetical protein WKI11_00175 [Enterococcus avium]|jgi:hypothetical protein|uniref:hypothetical protein n=1 Tax=Enterococcus avium TaxID=33945 RepID=UPI00383EDE7C
MEHWNIGFISTFRAWNSLEQLGTAWNSLEQLGTAWNSLERIGTPNKKREV